MRPTAHSLLRSPGQGDLLPDEHSPPRPVLVLAMGNILLEDEGLGIHALKLLHERIGERPQVEFLDGGTSGMALVDMISRRQHLIVLDAVQTGDPPGTLVRMSDEQVPVFFGLKVTPHQLGLADVLASLRLTDEQPDSVTVLGLVPQSLEMSLEPSDLIQARLGRLVDAVITELEKLGVPL